MNIYVDKDFMNRNPPRNLLSIEDAYEMWFYSPYIIIEEYRPYIIPASEFGPDKKIKKKLGDD